ncbi:MAG TPA: tetratricopeptide repeat protein [Opitutaceae bacterium]
MSEFPRPTPPDHAHKLGGMRKTRPRHGWRRLLPFRIERGPAGRRVRIRWGALASTLAVLAVAGYAGLAAGAYGFVKYRRGVTEVRFLDILLPTRWPEYQKARGNHHVLRAQEQLKAGRYREAFQNLRVGLTRSPAHREGRLLLAQFFVASRRPDLAQRTLLEGVAYHENDVDYLKAVFSFLLQHEEDAEVISLAQRLLAAGPDATERNRLVVLAAASAQYFRGNYDLAESQLEKHRVGATRDGRLLIARIQWERGHRELAVQLLRALAGELPRDNEIYGTLVSYLRDLGRDSEARRVSLVRQLDDPRNARARIDVLYAYQKDGDTARAAAAVAELLRDFGNDQDALLALAEFAANTGDVALAQRVYELCRTQDAAGDRVAFMAVEARIVARDYQSALEAIDDLLKTHPEWDKHYASVLSGLQAIAFCGRGDAEAAQRALGSFLAQPNLRVENLLAVSNRLLAVGARAQARQVLAQASAADPRNQAALTNLIKLDLATDNTDALPANVRRLLTTRKPAPEVLRAAYRKLGSDRFLFSPGRTALLDELRQALPLAYAAPSGS